MTATAIQRHGSVGASTLVEMPTAALALEGVDRIAFKRRIQYPNVEHAGFRRRIGSYQIFIRRRLFETLTVQRHRRCWMRKVEHFLVPNP